MRLDARVANGLKAATVVAVLCVGWIGSLRQGQSTPPAASTLTAASAFQPVPDTSPVPTDYLKQASATQSSSRTEFVIFQSVALGRPMHYLIYQPPGYSAQKRYPVLYLLHGIGAGFGESSGYETEWPGYGVLTVADTLVAAGSVPPLLIVMPEGDQSYWMDAANGGPKFGTYVAEDLVKEIDSRFPTRSGRGSRAIGGLSMGGFGALSLAMLRPDVFGIAGAHSPSLPRREQGPAFFGDADYFAAHNPVELMRDQPDVARTLRLWLDVGDQDPQWTARSEGLHHMLSARGVPHEWHEWPGNHDGIYWNVHLADYLRFYGAALKPE